MLFLAPSLHIEIHWDTATIVKINGLNNGSIADFGFAEIKKERTNANGRYHFKIKNPGDTRACPRKAECELSRIEKIEEHVK
jgi:hypothetical protein